MTTATETPNFPQNPEPGQVFAPDKPEVPDPGDTWTEWTWTISIDNIIANANNNAKARETGETPAPKITQNEWVPEQCRGTIW